MLRRRAVSLLLFLLGHFGTIWCISLSSFSQSTFCDFQESLDNECFEIIKNHRDQMECFAICGWKDACLGTLIIVNSSACYHQKTCSFAQTCRSSNPTVRYYIKGNTDLPSITSSSVQTTAKQDTTTSDKPTTTSLTTQATTEQYTTTSPEVTTPPSLCQHSGTPLTSEKCNCNETGGWVGDRCERRPYNCNELANFGYSTETQLFPIDIYKNGSLLVNTPCNVGSTSNDIGVLKSTGQLNFNLSWSDYVSGFLLNENNYFLGLDNILAYNKQGLRKISVILTFKSSTISGKITQEYYNFVISGSSTGYSYTIGGGASSSRSFGGTGSSQGYDLGDIFAPGQNARFSTYNNDQDTEPDKNCASLTGTGWWFKTCTPEPMVSPLGNKSAKSAEVRIILPKCDTTSVGPRDAFKHIYMYLTP